ncbi:MAG: bacteriohemerythrin [Candidatus Saccharibacteria bacterium]
MAYIEWQQDYSVGVALIDEQHKHFVGILNKLYETIQSAKTKELATITTELVKYTKTHFDTEEKYFKEFKYEYTDEHIAEHKRLIGKVGEFLENNGENHLIRSFELLEFLEDWLVGHLATMDKSYTKCFNEHGLK